MAKDKGMGKSISSSSLSTIDPDHSVLMAADKSSKMVDNFSDVLPPKHTITKSVSEKVNLSANQVLDVASQLPVVSDPLVGGSSQFTTPIQVSHQNPVVTSNFNHLSDMEHRIQFGTVSPWSANYNMPPDPSYLRFLAATQHFDFQNGQLGSASTFNRAASYKSLDIPTLQNVSAGKPSYFVTLDNNSPDQEKKKKKKKKKRRDVSQSIPFEEENLDTLEAVQSDVVQSPAKEGISKRTRSAGKKPAKRG